ncbi:hypothetical protein ACEUZ9_001103 [Paracoccus litorisediminis]|uniref:hypothetical protein n=1 Tax=Paracoccus litorisediminis TaxID=2006130 RepID=UPI003734BCD4
MAVTMTPGVHVELHDRRFIVFFRADNGAVWTIKERKIYAAGQPWENLWDAPYWHGSCHKIGKPWTLTARIVAAAEAKLRSAEASAA